MTVLEARRVQKRCPGRTRGPKARLAPTRRAPACEPSSRHLPFLTLISCILIAAITSHATLLRLLHRHRFSHENSPRPLQAYSSFSLPASFYPTGSSALKSLICHLLMPIDPFSIVNYRGTRLPLLPPRASHVQLVPRSADRPRTRPLVSLLARLVVPLSVGDAGFVHQLVPTGPCLNCQADR